MMTILGFFLLIAIIVGALYLGGIIMGAIWYGILKLGDLIKWMVRWDGK